MNSGPNLKYFIVYKKASQKPADLDLHFFQKGCIQNQRVLILRVIYPITILSHFSIGNLRYLSEASQ